ncbi:type III-B CRISPR module RAMP protein Cmr6 [Roseospira navarrensis]|uniref:Type III-B CRISPR module RAMP protein Cmr6 n=1 Tax=Roseospira navarrensis TaxID=140058 RepID=A0A7X2D3M6_9PROT|nr:type III-B CRISPR module RAMP protein Cmr6 [Roseospira navarrensis]MQX37569.1 type III-B CRISPR module RAMP protein Cmr6 [Roseospira navarrensis]
MCEFPLTPGGPDARRIVASWITAAEANPGLVWDRYLPLWQGDTRYPKSKNRSGKTDGTPTKQALDRFVEDRQRAGHAGKPWMLEQGARQRRALEALARRSGRVLTMVEARTLSRFVTGLGADHPTDNGFRFDPSSGLPFLPGSAVKGLCRRAAELEGRSQADRDAWFGPDLTHTAVTAAQGGVSFFDGVPLHWPSLAVDVVTSHHPTYYRTLTEKDGFRRKPPTETEDPVPVPFLTVDAGAVFSIPLLSRAAEAEAVASLLVTGLSWLGLGAKTAVGYGIMDAKVAD